MLQYLWVCFRIIANNATKCTCYNSCRFGFRVILNNAKKNTCCNIFGFGFRVIANNATKNTCCNIFWFGFRIISYNATKRTRCNSCGFGLRIISDNATKCTHCNEPHSVSSVSCTFKIIDGDNKITLVAFFLVKCYWSYNKHYFIFTDCDKEYSINISYQLYCDRCFCLLKQNVCFLFTDLKCA